jgi:hypothetical protein
VISFITTYPLGEKRMTAHMKQMVTNCSYAYEDGRKSSFEALSNLVRLLPLSLLEDHSQAIFLPMTLRLVKIYVYVYMHICIYIYIYEHMCVHLYMHITIYMIIHEIKSSE